MKESEFGLHTIYFHHLLLLIFDTFVFQQHQDNISPFLSISSIYHNDDNDVTFSNYNDAVT